MKNKGQAVLIFGSFNPVTKAHVEIGELAQRKYPGALIIYVPTKTNYLVNGKNLTDGNIINDTTRCKLLQDAVTKYGFIVSFYEIRERASGYSIDTINHFKHFFDVIVCIGADNISGIHKWKDGKSLVKENKFLVVARDGDKGELDSSLLEYKDNFDYVYNSCLGCSSTKIRNAYKNKDFETIKMFAPANVYEYLIGTEGVYI